MIECPFCKTELSQHKAGRCMDAWVAKLLGLSVKHVEANDGFYYYKRIYGGCWHWIPHYSTDHNDCFKYVVAEMHSHWDKVAIYGSNDYDHKWWHVSNCLHDYDRPEKHQYSAMGQDEGLPLVICRAFIKWRMEDE